MKLTRFWFTFNLTFRDPQPPGVLIGCGVTASGEAEAIRILREAVFSGYRLPEIKTTVTGVDVSRLDQDHVVPNMGDPTRLGVWFPLGYS